MTTQPTVLIADDSPTLRRIVSTVLERAGFTVVTAEDGVEAVQGVFRTQPDAVILDIRMPGMSGVEFLRQIRSDTRLSQLPVGIVTGDYFLSEQVLAELGALGAVVRYKPVWMADLISLARSLLSGTIS